MTDDRRAHKTPELIDVSMSVWEKLAACEVAATVILYSIPTMRCAFWALMRGAFCE